MITPGTPANLNTPLRLRCLSSSGRKYPGGDAIREPLKASGATPQNSEGSRKEPRQ